MCGAYRSIISHIKQALNVPLQQHSGSLNCLITINTGIEKHELNVGFSTRQRNAEQSEPPMISGLVPKYILF